MKQREKRNWKDHLRMNQEMRGDLHSSEKQDIIDEKRNMTDERVLETLTTAHPELSSREAEAVERAIENLPDTEDET